MGTVKALRQKVHGVLYIVTLKELELLDGYKNQCIRKTVKVYDVQGRPYYAQTHVMAPPQK